MSYFTSGRNFSAIFINRKISSYGTNKYSESAPYKTESDYTLSQLGRLEDLNLSIFEWSKYKERGVDFEDFISYKQELQSSSGALVRSLIFPGWGQYYTGHPVRGIIYNSAFFIGVADILFSPGLLNKAPFNNSQFGLTSLVASVFISYGVAPIDALISVRNYNRKLRSKYYISLSPPNKNKPGYIYLTYSF